jgi:Ran GTPase-activating protein (RanGAP) involved in mRNA processing and transport
MDTISVLQRNLPKRKPAMLAPPDKEAVFTSDQVKRLF